MATGQWDGGSFVNKINDYLTKYLVYSPCWPVERDGGDKGKPDRQTVIASYSGQIKVTQRQMIKSKCLSVSDSLPIN